MKVPLAMLLVLATAACARSQVDEPCGKPGNIWVHTDDFVYPDLNAIHKIEISHMNQILVNGVAKDKIAVKEFLGENRHRPFDILMFDFDAHSDCDEVRSVRKTIEDSGFCGEDNCVYGDAGIKPPEYKRRETQPN